MNNNEILVKMLLEFMLKEYEQIEYDYYIVKNRFDFRRYSYSDVYDLMVLAVRLDIVSSEFRKIREIIETFG